MKRVFSKGVIACIPMLIGGIPFGVLFGSLSVSYGFSPWFAIAMSSIVFAGSAQFVAIGLIFAEAPLWVIVSTTFIVNLRHLLYAADMVKFIKHLPLRWRIVLGFGLVDESYASIRPMYDRGELDIKNGHYAFLGAFLSFYIMWQVCTIIGVVAGEVFPSLSEWGMEFAMVATFISIITPYLKYAKSYMSVLPYWLALGSASVGSLLLYDLPHSLGLLVSAIIGVLVGFITRKSLVSA